MRHTSRRVIVAVTLATAVATAVVGSALAGLSAAPYRAVEGYG